MDPYPNRPMPMTEPIRQYPQMGAVLPISLMILLILTIVGVASMQSATFEEHKTGNMQDQNVALQSAEAALREVEIGLLKPVPEVMGVKIRQVGDFESGQPGLYHAQTSVTNQPEVQDFEAGANAIEATSILADSQNAPTFTVTYVKGIAGNSPALSNASEASGARLMDVIKITTRSYGMNAQTKIVLVSQVGLKPIPE